MACQCAVAAGIVIVCLGSDGGADVLFLLVCFGCCNSTKPPAIYLMEMNLLILNLMIIDFGGRVVVGVFMIHSDTLMTALIDYSFYFDCLICFLYFEMEILL